MIAGLGLACKLVNDNIEDYIGHMRKMRTYLEKALKVAKALFNELNKTHSSAQI